MRRGAVQCAMAAGSDTGCGITDPEAVIQAYIPPSKKNVAVKCQPYGSQGNAWIRIVPLSRQLLWLQAYVQK